MDDVFRDMARTTKQAAVDAVKALKMCNIYTGTVLSVSPLAIQTELKMTLGPAQLVLSQDVTEHNIDITGPDGRTTYMIHNALSAGDKVILARQLGGQKFFVLGKGISS